MHVNTAVNVIRMAIETIDTMVPMIASITDGISLLSLVRKLKYCTVTVCSYHLLQTKVASIDDHFSTSIICQLTVGIEVTP